MSRSISSSDSGSNFGLNRKVAPLVSKPAPGLPKNDQDLEHGRNLDSRREGKASQRKGDEELAGQSYSHRLLSRFLNSDFNNLRQQDTSDDRVISDAPTHASHDSSVQEVLRRSLNYTSTRGQWDDVLYPQPDVLDLPVEISALADFRQDSRVSLMDTSTANESIISKVTFDDTLSGDTAVSRLTFDTMDTASYASRETAISDTLNSKSSYDQRLRDKMLVVGRNPNRSQLSNPSRTPARTQRIGELNDVRNRNLAARLSEVQTMEQRRRARIRAELANQANQNQHENHSQSADCDDSVVSLSTVISGGNSLECGGPDVVARNPYVSTERQRQEERAAQLAEVRANAYSHAALLNLPNRNQRNRSEQPSTVITDNRPYCAPAPRLTESHRVHRTTSIESARMDRAPDVVSACSASMPQAMTFREELVTVSKPKPIGMARKFPIAIWLRILAGAGLIVLISGLAVVIDSRSKSSPANAITNGTYTVEPTPGPTVRWDFLLEDLKAVSSPETLGDPESPQNKAAYWLSQMDNLSQDYDFDSMLQRYSLTVLYHALTEAGASTQLSGWLDTSRHECEWGSAIICGDSGSLNNKVVALDLRLHTLEGILPDEIRLLDNLESLHISQNTIYGTIPVRLGTMSNLRLLDIERNALSGSIPASIGGLKSLTHLDLSHNFLDSSIPSELFQLKVLQSIDLSFNQLNGPFSTEFGSLSMLSAVDVRVNKLNGTFPESLYQLTDLSSLHIDYNEISGMLPQYYDFMAKLEFLSASNNLLTGVIQSEAPSELQSQAMDEFLSGKWRLQTLDMSNNFFSGVIPPLIEALENIKFVALHGNMFSGPLLTFSKSNAEHMNVANNQLTGTIPTVFGALLTHLDCSDNQLSGSIPSELATMKELTHLCFSDNKLMNGTLPSEFGDFRRIQSIDLSNCSLSGSLPTTWEGLTNLVNLTLKGNQLTGKIPSTFQSLSSLRRLVLKNNDLTGTIPTSLGRLSALELMDLSENLFSGHIPDELSSLGRLVDLLLNANALTGSVPVGLCNMLGSEFSNFEQIHIDCDVFCKCCDIRNFGGVDCNNVPSQIGS